MCFLVSCYFHFHSTTYHFCHHHLHVHDLGFRMLNFKCGLNAEMIWIGWAYCPWSGVQNRIILNFTSGLNAEMTWIDRAYCPLSRFRMGWLLNFILGLMMFEEALDKCCFVDLFWLQLLPCRQEVINWIQLLPCRPELVNWIQLLPCRHEVVTLNADYNCHHSNWNSTHQL